MKPGETIHILLIHDRELSRLFSGLEQAGYKITAEQVNTLAAFVTALPAQPWDLILTAASFAESVLEHLTLDIPVIVLFEQMDEEMAAALMRQGADDAFALDNLTRFVPAVEREVRDARERHQRRRAEAAVREQARFDTLLHKIALLVNEAVSEGEMFRAALEAVCTSLEWPVGHAYTLENHFLYPSDIWFLQPPDRFESLRQRTESRPAVRGDSFIWRVFSTGKPVWKMDIQQDTRLFRQKIFEATGLQTGFAFPVLKEQQVVAVLEFFTHAALPPDDIILKTMEQISALLSRVVEREQARQALKQNQRHLAAIFEHTHTALLLLNDEFICVEANPAACRLLGYERAELLNQSILRLVKNNERAEISAYWIEFLQTKKMSGEYSFQKADGSKAIFEYRAVADIIPHLHLLVMNDITERKQQETQLTEAKTLLEKTFASMNEVVMVVDPTTRTLLMCNPAIEQIFGYTPAEVIGQKTTFMHIDDDHYQRFVQLYGAAIEQHGVFQSEYPVRRKDGTVIITEMTIIPTRDDSEWQKGVIGVFRDITARKQMEQAEREQRILAEALRDSITVLTSTLELKEVMQRILENVGRVVPHESANIMMIEGDSCRIAYMNGYSQADQVFLAEQRFPLQLPNLHIMLATRQPHLVADVRLDSNWLKIPGTEWIKSHMGVPICRQGQVIGFLNLDSSVAGFFTPTHIERLQAFADQAAIAIENAQVYVTLSQYANEMATLNRATAYLFAPLSTSQGIEELGKQIVYAVLKAFGKVDCGIMLVDPQANQLIRLVREGDYHVQATTSLYLDGPGLAPEAIRRRETVYAPDVSADPRYIRSDPRTRSELVIPLQTQNNIIGVLDLQSDELDAFSVNDQRLLKAFAERAATAIENAQLYREVQLHATILEQRVAERTLLLEQAREHVEAILNSSSEGVVFAYPDGTIRQTNPAFDDLFGYDMDEPFGKSLTALVIPEHAEQIQAMINTIATQQSGERFETTAVRNDGSTFEVEIALSAIQGKHRASAGLVCTFHDISQHKRIEDFLRLALEKEREMGELKNRLVSMVSHEFRTPLATIQVTIDSLQSYFDKFDLEQRAKRFEKIRTQIQHMTHLLEDALTLSYGEGGTLKLTPIHVNLPRFCQNIMEEVQATTRSNPLILTHTGACDTFTTDERLLRQILTNLLTNAVKYSYDEHEVQLEVACYPDHVQLKIRDRGIGIPEKDKKLLFEAFHRARNVGTISGTGLGLTITKQAVDMLKGTISFESEEGSGTIFTVTLPNLQEQGAYAKNPGD